MDRRAPADRAPVTVVGLGPMGAALAAAFIDNGHPTTVWNRTAAKAEPLVAKGARLAATPAEAVEASSLVVVCVNDFAAVRSILDGVGAVRPHRGEPDLRHPRRGS